MPFVLCACGCGKQREQTDERGRIYKFIKGHKIRKEKKIILCACGCNEKILERHPTWRQKRRFKEGHQNRGAMNGMYGKNAHLNPHWKGGRYKTSHGYIVVFSPNHPYKNNDGYVYEHRLMMEKKLGRYLTNDEVIHHKNGNKEDNRIENLELMPDNKIHLAYHRKINVS